MTGKSRAWRGFGGSVALLLALVSGAARAENEKSPAAFAKAFDEAEFRGQVVALPSEEGVTALRIGYFMRRVRHPLERDKALSILKEELAKESRGTARWYALQSLYAFGHMRSFTSSDDKVRSHQEYLRLFQCAATVGAGGGGRVVAQAARDYLVAIQSGQMGMVNFPEVADVVAEALPAMAQWWIGADDAPAGDELAIPAAATRAGPNVGKAMLKAVEACQPPGAKEHTYPRLKRAAICIEAEAPGKAVEYLKNAEPLIPADDKEEAFRLYTRLAAALAKLKDYDAALATQQRCIQRTGRGLAGVGRAHLARGAKDEVRKVLESLKSPGSNEADVVDLARDLATARERESAIELLAAYLGAERPRDPMIELDARVIAAQAYAELGRQQEALQTLGVEHLRDHMQTTAQRLAYGNALALRTRLAHRPPSQMKLR